MNPVERTFTKVKFAPTTYIFIMNLYFRTWLLLCALSMCNSWNVQLDTNIQTKLKQNQNNGNGNIISNSDISNSTFIKQVVQNHRNEVWSTGFFLLTVGILAGMQAIVLYKTTSAMVSLHNRVQAIEEA